MKYTTIQSCNFKKFNLEYIGKLCVVLLNTFLHPLFIFYKCFLHRLLLVMILLKKKVFPKCHYEHFWFQKRPFIIMYCLDNNCRFGNQNIRGDRLQHQYIINIIVKCRLFYIYIYTRPCALLNKNNDIALSLFFKKGNE